MNQSQQNTLLLVGAAGVTYYLYTQGKLNTVIDQLGKLFEGLFNKGGSTTPPPPSGGGTTPPPSGGQVPAGTVLYDSNAGWTAVRTAASGSPKWEAGSDGVGRLSAGAGHGRVYIDVPNYNAVMTGNFMFESGFTGNNNLSLRMRSRHASCGSPGNIFGGFGASIHMDGEVGFETEPCHNQHENSINGTLPFTPELGKWYNFAYYVVDSVDKSSVKFRLDIDGQTVHTGSHDSPQPDYLDEATFLQESSVWLRMNNDQQAVLAFKDFKVIAQEPGSLDGGATTTAYARSYRGRIPKSRPRYYPYFYTQPTTNYMAMAGKKRRSHAPGPGDLACIA